MWSFAETGSNGEVAPIPDLRGITLERGGSTGERALKSHAVLRADPYWRDPRCAQSRDAALTAEIVVLCISPDGTRRQSTVISLDGADGGVQVSPPSLSHHL
jgi:hypothetical protein